LEPKSDCLEVLYKNIRRNDLESIVTVYEGALGSVAGRANLYMGATGNRGDHRLFDANDDAIFNPRRKRTVTEVSVFVLDEVLKSRRVDIIKMDVQGYEPYVLDGMKGILEENRSIVLISEFWPYGIEKANRDPLAYLTSIQSLGFELFELTSVLHGALSPLDAVTLTAKMSGEFNFNSLSAIAYVDLIAVRREFVEAKLSSLAKSISQQVRG